MKIIDTIFKSYEYKFRTPIQLAGVQLKSRKGFYLWLQDGKGLYGLGEIAPLPGYSTELLEEVEASLIDLQNSIYNRPIELQISREGISGFSSHTRFPPSMQFGFEQALFDLEGKHQTVPVARLFNNAATSEIGCNVLIDRVEPSQIPEKVNRIIDDGFSTIKMKVGRTNFRDDLTAISIVREIIPSNYTIRLDANGSWSVDEALQNLKQLAEFQIEYVEQPIPRGHIEYLGELRIQSPVPIAVDEDIRSLSDLERVLYFDAADIVILKPMLLGGFVNAYTGALEAQKQDIGVVFTSVLESTVGRSGIAHLAAAISPDRAHGLTAGTLVEPEELTCLYRAVDGKIKIPQISGFGWNLKT